MYLKCNNQSGHTMSSYIYIYYITESLKTRLGKKFKSFINSVINGPYLREKKYLLAQAVFGI